MPRAVLEGLRVSQSKIASDLASDSPGLGRAFRHRGARNHAFWGSNAFRTTSGFRAITVG